MPNDLKNSKIVELQRASARLSELSLLTSKLAGVLPPKNQVGSKARLMLNVQFETLKIMKEVIDYINKVVQTIASIKFNIDTEIKTIPALTAKQNKTSLTQPNASVYDIGSGVEKLVGTDTSHVQNNSGADDWDP